MMEKRTFPMLLLVLLATGSLGTPGSQSETEQHPEQEIMWRKLDLSHRVLDALVLDDFDALEAFSEDLVSLGEAGEWAFSDSEPYASESARFRRAAREIGRAAQAGDTEAATLAYVDLTLGCIRCHQRLPAR